MTRIYSALFVALAVAAGVACVGALEEGYEERERLSDVDIDVGKSNLMSKAKAPFEWQPEAAVEFNLSGEDDGAPSAKLVGSYDDDEEEEEDGQFSLRSFVQKKKKKKPKCSGKVCYPKAKPKGPCIPKADQCGRYCQMKKGDSNVYQCDAGLYCCGKGPDGKCYDNPKCKAATLSPTPATCEGTFCYPNAAKPGPCIASSDYCGRYCERAVGENTIYFCTNGNYCCGKGSKGKCYDNPNCANPTPKPTTCLNPCGSACLPQNYKCCNGNGNFCFSDQKCCGDGCVKTTSTCCGNYGCTAGNKCCGSGCAPNNSNCCGDGTFCTGGKVCCGSSCCALGYRCSSGSCIRNT